LDKAMDLRHKINFLLLFLVLFSPGKGAGQFLTDSLFIGLDCSDSIPYHASLTMPDKCYKKIKNCRGEKHAYSDVQLVYNGHGIPVRSLGIRGETSLNFPKKSFTLKLDKKIDLCSTRGSRSLTDCYLLSLSMDRNYINNYLAFTLLNVLNISRLAFNFCEVVINNETQGIYLMTERPRDYALKFIDSPVIIRRGYEERIDKMILKKNSPRESNSYYRKQFHKLYKFCFMYSGSRLYDSLDSRIDLGQYMEWLAFNFLVRNGDYTDELYLYADPDDGRFRIIPWDYDDMFARQPHEGIRSRNMIKGGNYIFSSEDRLDMTIISDEFLYDKYLEKLLRVIEALDDSTLAVVFRDAYCSVYPYYLKPEIMETTRYDKYGLTNLGVLNTSINENLKMCIRHRDKIHSELMNRQDHCR
jgi:spore coat protein H